MHRSNPSALVALAALAVLSLLIAANATAGLASTERIYLPLLFCPTCAGTPAPTPTRKPDSYSPEQLRAVELANQARVAAGCPAASINPKLMQATQAWSEYMLKTSDYRHAPNTWYPAYGYPYGGLENIGGAISPEEIIEGWLGSASHRRNMLWCEEAKPESPEYTALARYEIGVGFADGYWTLKIGIRTD